MKETRERMLCTERERERERERESTARREPDLTLLLPHEIEKLLL
jgi:hypothetical protein